MAGKSSKNKIALLALVVIGLIIAGVFFDAKSLLEQSLQWIEGLGFWGPIAFVAIYIAATVLFLPGSILTLGAGAVFGLVYGAIAVSVASTTGAALAFLIGRYFARDWVSTKIESNQSFKAVDNAVGEKGWKIVFLTRLSPIFPFNLLNYAFGLTKVSFPHYVLASWVGMMPGTIMYVYVGTIAGELARLGGGEREKTTAEWALYIVGLVATVAVTLYVTKVAKKALKSNVDI